MLKSPLLIGLFALGFCFTSCNEQNNTTTESTDTDTTATIEAAGPSGDFTVDVNKSVVQWEGTMVGMYNHTGTVNLQKGKLNMENGVITQGSFVVDMTTLQATDENYNPEEGNTQEKLISHLESDDFFAVSEHPTASFTIRQVDGNTAHGVMTVRGTEQAVAIENLDVHAHDGEVHITGSTTFNRRNFGVEFSHPLEEMVVSDDVDLKIDITARQN